MDILRWLITVIALTAVGAETRTVDVRTAETTDTNRYIQTTNGNKFSAVYTVEAYEIAESLNRTERHSSYSPSILMQHDNLVEPIFRTGGSFGPSYVNIGKVNNNAEPTNLDITKNNSSKNHINTDKVSLVHTELEMETGMHDLIQSNNLKTLVEQLSELFHLLSQQLGPATRVKRSNCMMRNSSYILGKIMTKIGIQNLEKKYLWKEANVFNSRRIKRSGDMVTFLLEKLSIFNCLKMKRRDKIFKNPWLTTNLRNPAREKRSKTTAGYSSKKPFALTNPLSLIVDALYKYSVQIVNDVFYPGVSKKALPRSLEALNKLSNDEIRKLSYKHLSWKDRTSILFTSMLEGAVFATSEEQRDTRLREFWHWFRWFYVPDIIINILLGVTADTKWYVFPAFYEAFNTNPGGDLRDTIHSLRVFFSYGDKG